MEITNYSTYLIRLITIFLIYYNMYATIHTTIIPNSKCALKFENSISYLKLLKFEQLRCSTPSNDIPHTMENREYAICII